METVASRAIIKERLSHAVVARLRKVAHLSGLWRNRNFVVLFSAQAVSLAGSGVTTVALALLVHQIAGPTAATTVLGQALMLRIAAFLLFSQPAGVLADRVNRKYILIASDVVRLVLMGAFPFITTVWQVYAAVFTVNCLTAFFTPAFDASLPEVAGSDHYVQALSYSRIAVDVEAVAGPGVAAILVALVGLKWVFWFDAATYLISALLVAIVHLPCSRETAEPLALGALWRDLTHGVRVLVRESSIRQALTMAMAEALAGACVIVVTVVYVRDVLHASEADFSLTMMCAGLGSTSAAIVLGRITTRMERKAAGAAIRHGVRHRWATAAVLSGGIVLAFSLISGWLTPPLGVLGFLWALNGAGQALIAIPSSTLVASHTGREERGRAFAAQFAITHACWLISYPLTGHLASALGPARTFGLCGIGCLGITLAAMAMGGETGPHRHSGIEA
jgi:NRE family putative nickel resistance protein-like MFS transporter